MLRRIICFIALLGVFGGVLAQEEKSRLITPQELAALQDQGGMTGTDVEWVTGPLDGATISGARITAIHAPSPYSGDKLVKVGAVIWSVNKFFFARPEDMVRYLRSIAPSSEVSMVLRGTEGQVINSTFKMPPCLGIRTNLVKAHGIQTVEASCGVDKLLAMTGKQILPAICSDEALATRLKEELSLLQRAHSMPGAQCTELRELADKRLKDIRGRK